ncbi:hypothetical protein GO988_04115 [Hymenobacter sp. HMF4947]|uniref:NERD domain-containing protein n=1 Tax=Hymenobacter ginkgonis TaxID=2682976 RepID=A0A7K1TAT6_9BACT|nr:hypothetical protein [Hymenobacter ginkgonis]MVN75503.1 hypothetical protein [Hymenobacter ginkgonis]
MLVSLLPVPFADAARQRQYEAVQAALYADSGALTTVLLGNLAAFTSIEADALIVQPAGLALVVLTPHHGHLTIPTLAYGTWQLDGRPLPGRDGADNPFAHYRQQQPAALAWLGEQLSLTPAALPPCAGLALFEAPLTFGPAVEAQLHQHAAAHDFQLVATAEQLPARLHQLASAAENVLSEQYLLTWADQLTAELAENDLSSEPADDFDEAPQNFLEQKLRQLWRWLGAEDIPADPPYGGQPLPPTYLRDQQEQARLQQLRQELQAELHQQRREAAAREAAREQDLALLRQQLAQAGQSAAERQAEQQAKAALEESLRTTRAELAARNHELDTRIRQLGQLIGQLQPAAGPLAPTPSLPMQAPPAAPAAGRNPAIRRLRQAERWGLVAVALVGAGAGVWGLVRVVHPPTPRPVTTAQHRLKNDPEPTETADEPAEELDTVGAAAAGRADTSTAQPTEATTSLPETKVDNPPLLKQPPADSLAAAPTPAPAASVPDSAAPAPSPTP